MRNLWLGGIVLLAVGCGGGAKEAQPVTTAASAAPTATTPAPTASASAAPAATPKAPLADLIKKTMVDMDAAWKAHDAAKVAALYAPDGVMAEPGFMGWKESKKDEIQKDMDAYFKAFPDVRVKSLRVFTKGNMVAEETFVSGTNTGEFMGGKATGKKVGQFVLDIMWFNDDGLISKQHLYMDHLTMMHQLGKGNPKMKARGLEPIPTAEVEAVAAKDTPDEAKNADAIKAWYASFEKKDEKAYLAGLSDKVVEADYTQAADATGKDAAKKAWTRMTKMFPDIKLTPTTVTPVGDWVVSEVELTGTMKGPMGPVKASNKSGTIHLAELFKIKDGKVAWAGTFGSGAEFAHQFLPPPPGMHHGKPGDRGKPGAHGHGKPGAHGKPGVHGKPGPKPAPKKK